MRKKELKRKTKETDIRIILNIDGTGKSAINTGIPFFNHMLESFSKHSQVDLEIKAVGDIEVDFHHTIEDTGILLGEVFKQALGNKKGIKRFGEAVVPLDEALTRVSIDISGRPFLSFNVKFDQKDDGNNINPYLFEEFFRAFVNNAGITIHIDMVRGKNTHHIIESIFKAFALSIKDAVKIETNEIPSTKGII
jgi:imidazoleglycerol-phosphate dehydratase